MPRMRFQAGPGPTREAREPVYPSTPAPTRMLAPLSQCPFSTFVSSTETLSVRVETSPPVAPGGAGACVLEVVVASSLLTDVEPSCPRAPVAQTIAAAAMTEHRIVTLASFLGRCSSQADRG